jgi:N-acetylglucosaminyl-diphospho-decaprenol L-rhamnosyltransferase
MKGHGRGSKDMDALIPRWTGDAISEISRMDLSIVVVNWNTRALLAQCLDSLFAYPPDCAFEVWLVDNGSSDGSVEMVRDHYPQVHVLVNAQNLGFARANNQAIRASTGRYVLLLNSDAAVRPRTLATMLTFAEAHPIAAALGCQLLNADQTLQPSAGVAPSLAFELLTGTSFASLSDPYHDTSQRRLVPPPEGHDYFDVEHISGAFMWVRREALERVDLFDESFFLYGEESDLCYRLRKSGWRIYYCVRASAVHQIGASAEQIGEQRIRALYRGKYRYFRKHHGRLAAESLRIILLLRGTAKYVYELCRPSGALACQKASDWNSPAGLSLVKAAFTL